MHEIKPLEWRDVSELVAEGAIQAETIGGVLRCVPYRDRHSGESGWQWVHIRRGERVDLDEVATLDAARAKCEQIHRDLVLAWLVPAGQVMDKPDEPGVYWIEGESSPQRVHRLATGQMAYFSATRGAFVRPGRVAKVGPNPFAKGGGA